MWCRFAQNIIIDNYICNGNTVKKFQKYRKNKENTDIFVQIWQNSNTCET